MSTGARVESIDALKIFRVHLTKFREAANAALSDADSEISRTQTWLEGDRENFWAQQIRKRGELVQRAEEQLRGKRLFKDASGSTPSAVEEQKAVALAKKNLAEAEMKLNNVRKWNRKLQKEMILYKGSVARFANSLTTLVPGGVANLAAMIELLEKYLELGPAAGAMGGIGIESAGVSAGTAASMSRSPEGIQQIESAIDPGKLRASVPAGDVLESAPPLPAELLSLACEKVLPEQRTVLARHMAEAPAEDLAVLIAQPALFGKRIFLLRGADQSGLAAVVGSIDDAEATAYNKTTVAELSRSRPDLAELLKLPAAWLVILGSNGLEIVYNNSNIKML
jgi:hypothetical protein